jgi:hypothetical protein
MTTLLHFLKWNAGLALAETQTTEAERDCLARYAAGRRLLAEVGVWHGVTSARLRAVMAADAVLYAVDPFYRGRLGFSMQMLIAHREVERVSNGRVVWMRTTGAQAASDLAPNIGGKLEFLFIDGEHSYEGLSTDWEGWSGLMATGGVVALHDSRSTSCRPIDQAGSVMFTDAVIRKDARFRVIDEIDSLTILECVRE